jgi:diaminopimelate decarboxylase
MADNTYLNRNTNFNSEMVPDLAGTYSTPLYLYDERMITDKCFGFINMTNAFGINPRYAMKANSNKAILQLIGNLGLSIDASSLNETIRAHLSGIPLNKIMLTTQEVPEKDDRALLEQLILKGLKYNVCSIRQFELISGFVSKNNINLSIRIHPGVGSGESATRNTGDKYSCFGIHLSDIDRVMLTAREKNVKFDAVHVHIGSGGDPEKWRENIDRELSFIEKFLPDVTTVNFGGGFKEARMPDETPANLDELGAYAKKRIEEFHEKTGRKLNMEVEPGTYIMANSGFIVTRIIDKKRTGDDGFNFLILDGGLEVNSRPLLYGSRHPFYLISSGGKLLSSEFTDDPAKKPFVVAGRCCESGDTQTLDGDDHIIPRLMNEPQIGDYLVIGGAGAYCSSMAPFNYNSHLQSPELLLRSDGSLKVIRKKQTLMQILENEIPLDK